MLNLLATICICMGLGANSNPLYNTNKNNKSIDLTPQIQRENENVSNYELTINQYNSTTSTYAYDSNYTYGNAYTQLQAYNNAISVIGTHYRQYAYQTANSSNRWVLLQSEENIGLNLTTNNVSSRLVILQITPYNINKDTQITMRVNATIDINTNYNAKVYVTTGLIETTENIASYIDNVSVTTDNLNKTYADIISPQNGFIYDEQRKNYIGNTNVTNLNTTIQYDINISQGQTKYLVLLQQFGCTPAGTAEPYNTTSIHSLALTQNANTTIKIIGTHIIPTDTTEVIDIPDIMFNVLTMPFTFISVAFNLTLFPGTPYQLNISNLFLTIIAILVFVLIMKLIISKVGN